MGRKGAHRMGKKGAHRMHHLVRIRNNECFTIQAETGAYPYHCPPWECIAWSNANPASKPPAPLSPPDLLTDEAVLAG